MAFSEIISHAVLAVSSVHPQLSRCRRPSRGAWHRGVLRSDSILVPEVWTSVCSHLAAATRSSRAISSFTRQLRSLAICWMNDEALLGLSEKQFVGILPIVASRRTFQFPDHTGSQRGFLAPDGARRIEDANPQPAMSVAHVRGPTMPSGTRPLSRWNCLTAASVLASNRPVAGTPIFI